MIKSLITILLMSVTAMPQTVKTGLEVLMADNYAALKGKRVGLITNPTAVDTRLNSTIDILSNAPGVQLTAIYGPEHGARGEYAAGDYVSNYTDEKTGIPVYSLYGKNKKPNADMLKDVDVLLFDIQDIGCRSYTYISTMGLAMEAAAEFNKEFIVLDRPNPLGGNKVEGGPVEPGFISFVSQFNVPYVHGLTVGELALLLNGEGMLKDGKKCNLKVIGMKGWNRNMLFRETGLPWVLTSPHIPYTESPVYYVTTGIIGELGVISEGVGYTIPFQTFAAEWINGDKFATAMNALGLEGVIFRPLTFKPFYGKSSGKTLHGVQIFITDYNKADLLRIQFSLLEVHNKMYKDKNPFDLAEKSRHSMFDKVVGTDKVRETFVKYGTYESVKDLLNKDVEKFKEIRSKYLLY